MEIGGSILAEARARPYCMLTPPADEEGTVRERSGERDAPGDIEVGEGRGPKKGRQPSVSSRHLHGNAEKAER